MSAVLASPATAARRHDTSPVWMSGHAADVPEGDGWLTPAEREAQQRFVLTRRRADWRLGRWTAKTALAEWLTSGASDGSVAAGSACTDPSRIGIVARGEEDGYPLVEGLGTAPPRVSLTHRNGLAVACVAPAEVALGCDLEFVEPRPERFASDWFDPAECERVRRTPPAGRDELVTLTWSAKESALKATGDGLRVDTRTVATEITEPLHQDHSWGRVHAAVVGHPPLAGWWRRLLGHVLVVLTDRPEPWGPPRRLWFTPPTATSPRENEQSSTQPISHTNAREQEEFS